MKLTFCANQAGHAFWIHRSTDPALPAGDPRRSHLWPPAESSVRIGSDGIPWAGPKSAICAAARTNPPLDRHLASGVFQDQDQVSGILTHPALFVVIYISVFGDLIAAIVSRAKKEQRKPLPG